MLLAVHEAGLTRDAVADVTVNDVVEVLSAAGSAWHREDVIRAFCDLQRRSPAWAVTGGHK